MLEDKHIEAIKEVQETIEEAIGDPRGLLPRQRRLISMLSLGAAHLVEIYLHRQNAIKPGAQIKHDWFSSENRRIKLHLAGVLTKSFEALPNIDQVLYLSHEIEQKRNELVYCAALKNESFLREKLDLFLELKKIVENSTGEIRW